MVTIKEIAREAKVSPTTVSLILNNKSKERKISALTEQRVLQIAERMGYSVSAVRNCEASFCDLTRSPISLCASLQGHWNVNRKLCCSKEVCEWAAIFSQKWK